MRCVYHCLSVFFITFSVAHAQVLDIAHRGYAAVNPESTLEAFKLAHEQGADGIEFDVRQTSDDVLVVTHDPSIKMLGGRLIEKVTFSDIYLETNIPSLEEVLIFAKQVDQTIWLEIKQSHRYPNIINNVLSLIVKYGLEASTVIQSFNHQDLKEIQSLQPRIRLLALFSSNFRINRVPNFINYVGLPMTQVILNSQLIAILHRAGKQVILWRRDDRSETAAVVNAFIAAGADGFMLDKPLKLLVQH